MLNFINAINRDNILFSLEVFWKGMLAIVIVLSAICLATIVLKKTVAYFEDRHEKARTAKQQDEKIDSPEN